MNYLVIFIVFLVCVTANAQDTLTTITNPGGGQIVYGPVPGPLSLESAMIAMLRNVHHHFGDRPQIGKFYQARGTSSMATFFALTDHNPPGKSIRGMVLVSLNEAKQKVDGALLFDDAGRFETTWNSMLTQLNAAWGKNVLDTTRSSPPNSPSQPVPPLHKVGFSDGSGTIGLPAEWHITSSGGGSVVAAGPNDELVAAGVIWQIYDPTTPQGRGLIQYLTNNGRKPLPARSAISPCCDLVRAWVAAQQTGGHQASFRLIATSRLARPGGGDAVLAKGELDNHDGKGPMITRLQLERLSSGGTFGMSVFRLSVPARLADQEMPTLETIAQSLTQNGQVIWAEAGREIDANNKRAEAARALAAQKSADNDRHNRDIEASQDEQAKRNQAVDNYILDRSVVEHIDSGAHGTTGYALADVLVRQFPDKFQYVPTQNFIKGVDY
jgi:hypothetical protein